MNRVEVVAAIIVNNGKLLLAQRPPQGDQAGLWEFPGGKIEPGETQQQALQRELHEELGINAQPESYVTSNSHPVNGRLIQLHGWYVPCFTGTPVNRHHTALVWVTPQEVCQYSLAPADIPILDTFMASPAATLAGLCP